MDNIQVGLFAIQGFQLFFSLFQTIIYKRKEYIYYNAYILCSIVYIIGLNRHLEHLDVIDQNFYLLMDKPLAFLCYFFYFKFAKYFLNIPSQHEVFSKKLRYIEYTILSFTVCIAIAVLLLNNALSELLFSLFAVITIPITVYAIARFNRLKKNNLNYFVVFGAILILAAAASTFVVVKFQLYLPELRNYPSSLHFHVFVIVELLVFSIGLGYKSYKIEHEKSKLDRQLVNELLENEKIKLKLDQTRNKIAKDLHDDLGASLSGIKILAGISAKETKDENVEQIYAITSGLLEDFKEVSWFLSEKEDNLCALKDRLTKWWFPILQAQHIELVIDIENGVEGISLSLLHKKNIYLMCKEAINNSMKYSGCSLISISFRLGEDGVNFHISDNGCYKSNESLLSSGIGNIKERMKEINSMVHFQLIENKNVVIEGKIPMVV